MKKAVWKRRAFAFLVAAAMVIPQGVYAADPEGNGAPENVIIGEVLERVHVEGCTLAPNHEGDCVVAPAENAEETQPEKVHEDGCVLASDHEEECEVEEKTEEMAMLKAPQDARAGGEQNIGNGDITISGDSCACSESDPHIITGTAKYHFPEGISFITVSSGNHYVKLNDVEVEQNLRLVPAMKIGDNANVTLILEGNNNLHGGTSNAGLYVSENAHLTIKGSGTLNAYGGSDAAGIGGSLGNAHCGHITIEDGNIRAEGGSAIGGGAAGIGSGYVAGGNCSGSVTINGGNVIAISGSDAAGIGGGENVGGCDVTINGGIVYAQGNESPSIGGGYKLIGEVDNGDFSTGSNGNAVIVAPNGIGANQNAADWDGIFASFGSGENTATMEPDGTVVLNDDNANIQVWGDPVLYYDLAVSVGTTLRIVENDRNHAPASLTMNKDSVLTNEGTINLGLNPDDHADTSSLVLYGGKDKTAGTAGRLNVGKDAFVKVPLTEDLVKVTPDAVDYDGKVHKPEVAVELTDLWGYTQKYLNPDDYTTDNGFENIRDAGEHKSTFTATPDGHLLPGGAKVTYTINKAKLKFEMAEGPVNISKESNSLLESLPKGVLDGKIYSDNDGNQDDVKAVVTWKDEDGDVIDESYPVPQEKKEYTFDWEVELTGDDAKNYELSETTDKTKVQITSDKPLPPIKIDSITGDSISIVYGDVNEKQLNVSLDGFNGTIPPDAIHWSVKTQNSNVESENVAEFDGNTLKFLNAGTATICVKIDRFEDTNHDVWYTGGEKDFSLTIKRKPIKVEDDTVKVTDRVYDGTKDVKVDAQLQNSAIINNDYAKLKATGTMATADAGQNKPVNIVFTLDGTEAGNYSLTPESGTAIVNIRKATLGPDTLQPKDGTLVIWNGKEATYYFSLSKLNPEKNGNLEIGLPVTYTILNTNVTKDGYFEAKDVQIKSGTLNLEIPVKAVESNYEGTVATITIQLDGKNFEPMTSTITVEVKNPQDFVIQASAGPNGSITPDGQITIAAGTTKEFAVSANTGYVIDDLLVDGSSIKQAMNEESYIYSFDNVASNHTIAASFKEKEDDNSGDNNSSGGSHTSNTYWVRYHNDDDTERDGKFIPGETVTVKGNVFTAPVGKVLAGWSLEEDGKVDYKVGDTFRMPGSSVDLYAVWKDAETESHSAYISGYPDGTVGPDKTITRAEAATMFYNLLADKNGDAKAFTDVPANQWYAKAVMTLAGKGVISGYPDGTFKPNAPITRAEFVTMAMNFANADKGTVCSFPDVPQNMWYYGAIAGATQNGWISGYPDGTFGPDRYITRAEVTSVINRMENRAADMSFMMDHLDELRTFSDLGFGHWAYAPMMEAANGHDYTRADQNSYESWVDIH